MSVPGNISENVALLKFRGFVALTIKEAFMPGLRFVLKMALYLGGWL
jgi:hypothetical protein